jgi:hypothetical protein
MFANLMGLEIPLIQVTTTTVIVFAFLLMGASVIAFWVPFFGYKLNEKDDSSSEGVWAGVIIEAITWFVPFLDKSELKMPRPIVWKTVLRNHRWLMTDSSSLVLKFFSNLTSCLVSLCILSAIYCDNQRTTYEYEEMYSMKEIYSKFVGACIVILLIVSVINIIVIPVALQPICCTCASTDESDLEKGSTDGGIIWTSLTPAEIDSFRQNAVSMVHVLALNAGNDPAVLKMAHTFLKSWNITQTDDEIIEDLADVSETVKNEFSYLKTASDSEALKKLVSLFMLDILPVRSNVILDYLQNRDKAQIRFGSMHIWFARTVFVVVIFVLVAMCIYLGNILPDAKQVYVFYSFIAWVFLDIFLVSTAQCYYESILIPSMAAKEVVNAALWIVRTALKDNSIISAVNSPNESQTDGLIFGELTHNIRWHPGCRFNAANYFFVSNQLAAMLSLESPIIAAIQRFRTLWPLRIYSEAENPDSASPPITEHHEYNTPPGQWMTNYQVSKDYWWFDNILEPHLRLSPFWHEFSFGLIVWLSVISLVALHHQLFLIASVLVIIPLCVVMVVSVGYLVYKNIASKPEAVDSSSVVESQRTESLLAYFREPACMFDDFYLPDKIVIREPEKAIVVEDILNDDEITLPTVGELDINQFFSANKSTHSDVVQSDALIAKAALPSPLPVKDAAPASAASISQHEDIINATNRRPRRLPSLSEASSLQSRDPVMHTLQREGSLRQDAFSTESDRGRPPIHHAEHYESSQLDSLAPKNIVRHPHASKGGQVPSSPVTTRIVSGGNTTPSDIKSAATYSAHHTPVKRQGPGRRAIAFAVSTPEGSAATANTTVRSFDPPSSPDEAEVVVRSQRRRRQSPGKN